MVFLLGVVLAQEAVFRPRLDHTGDISVVARLLADVRQGIAKGTSVMIENRDNPTSTFEAFSSYANKCSIKQIYAVPSATQRLPVSVVWDCGRLVTDEANQIWEERFASFWVDENRVTRVAFGKQPVVRVR
jgi:hypothetical protein